MPAGQFLGLVEKLDLFWGLVEKLDLFLGLVEKLDLFLGSGGKDRSALAAGSHWRLLSTRFLEIQNCQIALSTVDVESHGGMI